MFLWKASDDERTAYPEACKGAKGDKPESADVCLFGKLQTMKEQHILRHAKEQKVISLEVQMYVSLEGFRR